MLIQNYIAVTVFIFFRAGYLFLITATDTGFYFPEIRIDKIAPRVYRRRSWWKSAHSEEERGKERKAERETDVPERDKSW